MRYSVAALRSGQWVQYLVGYHRRQVGAPFYGWLASALGSGILGAVIAHYFERFMK